MDVKAYLESEKAKHLDSAKGIVDNADAEARSLTADESKEVERLTKAAAEYHQKLEEVRTNDELRASIDKLGAQVVTPGGGKVDAPASAYKSMGDAFVNSKAWKALMERGTDGTWATEPVELPYFGKANETIVSTNVELAGGGTYTPGVVEISPLQPNTLLSVVPQATTDSNRVVFLKETTATNAAAKVAEQGSHLQSILQYDTDSATVYKVGTLLYVSDEMLEDVSGIRSIIDGRLSYFVAATEEDLVLNGGGTTTVDGLFHQTTQAQPLGGDAISDAVYKAKTQVRTGSFLEPTHIIAHPTDWQSIRLQKDGNDNYMNGLGPFTGGAVEPPVWGLQPIVTSRCAQGTMLVGAFNPMALQMFRKRGISVEASNSNASLFETGQITLRASSRFALVVYRPAAFCEVTGL